jgi:uncharacterized RDD family membrane protein YckC
MAIFIDTMIQWILYIVIILLFTFVPILSNLPRPSEKWLMAIAVLAIFCTYWGYFALFETLWKGQTPGKRQAGIRVLKVTGREITAFEAILRNVLRAVDWLPSFYAVGVVTMFLNDKQQRLGDLAAGTIVVHERAEESLQQMVSSKPAIVVEQSFDIRKLSPHDIEIIEVFMQRRLDFDPVVRYQTASRIAVHVQAKLEIAPDQRPKHDEYFLEVVVDTFRSTARHL